jgi:hypothetical protein
LHLCRKITIDGKAASDNCVPRKYCYQPKDSSVTADGKKIVAVDNECIKYDAQVAKDAPLGPEFPLDGTKDLYEICNTPSECKAKLACLPVKNVLKGFTANACVDERTECTEPNGTKKKI